GDNEVARVVRATLAIPDLRSNSVHAEQRCAEYHREDEADDQRHHDADHHVDQLHQAGLAKADLAAVRGRQQVIHHGGTDEEVHDHRQHAAAGSAQYHPQHQRHHEHDHEGQYHRTQRTQIGRHDADHQPERHAQDQRADQDAHDDHDQDVEQAHAGQRSK